MIFRKVLNDTEALEAYKVSAVAFEYSFDISKAEEYINEARHRYSKYPGCLVAAFEDDGTLIGSIAPLPMNFYFDGHVVKGNGIGHVTTLPHKRNQGVIRGCFQKAYEIMKENGEELSYLYPFNRAYYKMFGYELNGPSILWTIPIENFKDKGSDYNIKLIDINKEYDLCTRVYEKVAQNYNLALEREEVDWKWLTKGDIYKEAQYTYVVFDKQGEPSAYFSYKKNENTMKINDIEAFFSTKESLIETFDFIKRSFHANFKNISIKLPSETPLEYIIENTTGISRELMFCGMVRVIDAEKILIKVKPKTAGEVILKINDKMCPWNNATFQCCFSDKKMTSVTKVEKEADIEMDISDFSAFISGGVTEEKLMYATTVKINSNLESIQKLFYAKKTNCFNYF